MRTAFFFDEIVAYHRSLLGPDSALLSAAVATVPDHRRHLHIIAGTLQHFDPKDEEHLLMMTECLLGVRSPAWTTFSSPELAQLLSTRKILAFVVRGLLGSDSRQIHQALKDELGYLGAIEVQFNEFTWAIYDSCLSPKYRICGAELRLFYREWETQFEDNRDYCTYEELGKRGLFSRVSWEDIGVQGTIFDPYDNIRRARMAGELEELIADQLSTVLDEILLRISQLDPRLVERLCGALDSFKNLDAADAPAHVSISCRRFIEQLANALYPPRNALIEGHAVGKLEYRNR